MKWSRALESLGKGPVPSVLVVVLSLASEFFYMIPSIRFGLGNFNRIGLGGWGKGQKKEGSFHKLRKFLPNLAQCVCSHYWTSEETGNVGSL